MQADLGKAYTPATSVQFGLTPSITNTLLQGQPMEFPGTVE
jgi:hypothetical protein